MGRRGPAPLTPRLVLDTSALIALERGDARARAHLAAAARRGFVAAVPVLPLIEALEGTRVLDRLNRVLAAIAEELPLLPSTGRAIPALKQRSGVGDTADATVVLEAIARPGSAILTGDPHDIAALLDVSGAAVHVPVLRV